MHLALLRCRRRAVDPLPALVLVPCRLVSGQTGTAALQLGAKPFGTGFFYDWTMGMGNDEAVPLAPRGSVGEWLEKSASPLERRNFFEFLTLLTNFERKTGLQQARTAQDTEEGDVTLQLGTRLKVVMRFLM